MIGCREIHRSLGTADPVEARYRAGHLTVSLDRLRQLCGDGTLDDDFLTLEIADNVEIKVQKTSVQTLLPKGTLKSAGSS